MFYFKVMNFFISQLQVVGFEAPLYMVFQICDHVAHSYVPYSGNDVPVSV